MTGVLLYLAVSILIGAAACFWGKKLFFQVFAAIVFLAVYDVAMSYGDQSVLAILIAILVALAAALLSKYLYKLSVFLLGALAGAGIGELLVLLFSEQLSAYQWPVIIALALVLGLCAVRWSKLIIILSTAYTGASLLAPSACFLVLRFSSLKTLDFGDTTDLVGVFGRMSAYLSGDFHDANAQTILIVTVCATIAGFLFQRFTAWKD